MNYNKKTTKKESQTKQPSKKNKIDNPKIKTKK
jgi:hypothetical protein